MQAFYNLRIATKLLVSFVAVLALTAVLGIVSVVQLAKVNQMSTDIATNWMPSARSLLEMRGLIARYRSEEMQHLLSATPEDMARYEKSMAGLWSELDKTDSQYEKLMSEPEEKKTFPEYVKALGLYAQEHEKVVALSRAGQKEGGRRADPRRCVAAEPGDQREDRSPGRTQRAGRPAGQ
ncbi:CHASE3 domain sensor protein [Variovorax sp. TBS-050B]|nr:CHASE3 domain sensor protein [Variovorax sp. TBS-050B]